MKKFGTNERKGFFFQWIITLSPDVVVVKVLVPKAVVQTPIKKIQLQWLNAKKKKNKLLALKVPKLQILENREDTSGEACPAYKPRQRMLT